MIKSTACSASEVKIGSGVKRSWIKGWETNAMRRLFKFNQKEHETVVGYCTMTARAARTIWTKMKLPFLI